MLEIIPLVIVTAIGIGNVKVTRRVKEVTIPQEAERPLVENPYDIVTYRNDFAVLKDLYYPRYYKIFYYDGFEAWIPSEELLPMQYYTPAKIEIPYWKEVRKPPITEEILEKELKKMKGWLEEVKAYMEGLPVRLKVGNIQKF